MSEQEGESKGNVRGNSSDVMLLCTKLRAGAVNKDKNRHDGSNEGGLHKGH